MDPDDARHHPSCGRTAPNSGSGSGTRSRQLRRGNIKIAADGGVFNLVTPDPNYNDQTITAFGDTPGFTGSAGWHEVVVDLTSFAGHTVEIRWTLGTDISEIDRGWYLDDITVTAWGGEVEPPFFRDGFESGDTGGWSAWGPSDVDPSA